MKHIFTFLLVVVALNPVFAQDEVGPIMNYRFPVKKSTVHPKRGANTIDSTFNYLSDTLDLPLFDDFSVSHFQQYDAEYTDPGITETLYYKLLDMSDNPLPTSTVYTSQVTYRTQVNTENNTSQNLNFTPVQVKYANFTAYPVNYTTTNGYPPYIIIDTISFPNPPDTIWIEEPEIYQDSARIFNVQINDPQSFWVDNHVFHNYTLGIDPWSLGVVTFDGLNAQGYPYAFGSTTDGVADFLTSKPFDLSGFVPGDSLYISFLVQRGGYGDEPESSDSLVLEFFNTSNSHWERAWGYKGGTNVEAWKVVNMRIIKPAYFSNAFKLRFKNYGGLSGSLDHFHIDYVNLHTSGGYQDSIFEDFAWSYNVGSLVKDYTSVPWDHWKNNFTGKMNDKVKVAVHNSFPIAKNPAISEVRISNPSTGSSTVTLDNFIMTEESPTADYAPYASANSLHDFTATNQFATTGGVEDATFAIKGLVTIQEPTYTVNDTCYTTQYFGDYYAYDDGSAEKAYGVTGAQGRLAVKFTSYEQDSLLAVRMHFVPSVNNVSNKLFLLTVWNDNGGKPGSVIYEDEFFFPRTPHYETGYNQFTTYYFKDSMRLSVPQTFYVGWRQMDADRLNIGLDMNNANKSKIFYSINGGVSWPNASYDASVMIRPVFVTQSNRDLSVDENELSRITVFPNPSNGKVTLRTEGEGTAWIHDAQGKLVGRYEVFTGESMLDLAPLSNGIYTVRFIGDNGKTAVSKLVIQQ